MLGEWNEDVEVRFLQHLHLLLKNADLLPQLRLLLAIGVKDLKVFGAAEVLHVL